MKEQEAHQHEKHDEKQRRLANKKNRERQMVIPAVDTIDYERQLRKVATRGGNFLLNFRFCSQAHTSNDVVIALFNAIFQAKKDSEIKNDEKTLGKFSFHNGTICAANRIVFTGDKKAPKKVNNSDALDVKQLTQEKFLEMLKNGKQSSNSVKAAEETTLKSQNCKKNEEPQSGWAAIKDDVMISKKLSLKVRV